MIISASRRTDIPAFFGEWFINRIRAEEVLVRNPVNPSMITRIPLTPDSVDCFVFWTKDPSGFTDALDLLDEKGFTYYFQFTLTAYDRRIEKDVARKRDLLNTFRTLSDRIGPERVVWRYDPVLFTRDLTAEYHMRWFDVLAAELAGYTEECIFSFLQEYGKIEENMRRLGVRLPGMEERRGFAGGLARIAARRGLILSSCAQPDDFGDLGIRRSRCIDPDRIGWITGRDVPGRKDPSQRKECGCAVSRDMGTYNTCLHNCLYCYANRDSAEILRRAGGYDPRSPLLCDVLKGNEQVRDLKIPGLASAAAEAAGQMELFV